MPHLAIDKLENDDNQVKPTKSKTPRNWTKKKEEDEIVCSKYTQTHNEQRYNALQFSA